MNKLEEDVKYYFEKESELVSIIKKSKSELIKVHKYLKDARTALKNYIRSKKLIYPDGYFHQSDAGLSNTQLEIANKWVENHLKIMHGSNPVNVSFSINWRNLGNKMKAECVCDKCINDFVSTFNRMPYAYEDEDIKEPLGE